MNEAPSLNSLADTHSIVRRRRLAHAAFILLFIQVILVTRTWWMPWLAQYPIFQSWVGDPRLSVPTLTPLVIHVQEITRHPSKPEYWNLKINIKNHTDQSINYPHLVLTFLDDKKHIVFRNVWAAKTYIPTEHLKTLAPHQEKSLSLWLKLPDNLPTEYNLDYFYPK
jgi:Protein of unknown function (DUF3426)